MRFKRYDRVEDIEGDIGTVVGYDDDDRLIVEYDINLDSITEKLDDLEYKYNKGYKKQGCGLYYKWSSRGHIKKIGEVNQEPIERVEAKHDDWRRTRDIEDAISWYTKDGETPTTQTEKQSTSDGLPLYSFEHQFSRKVIKPKRYSILD